MSIPPSAQLAAPDVHLTSTISHFYCVQHARAEPALPLLLLPNYQMLLVVNLGPAVPVWVGGQRHTIRRTALLGPLQQVLHYELPPGTDLLVVNFALAGFYRLTGQSMQRFGAGWFHAPPLLASLCPAELWQQLAGLPPGPERLALLSEQLQRVAVAHPPPVVALLDAIQEAATAETASVPSLAGAHRLSIRSLQLRCQTYLGCSLQEISHFLRFDRLARTLRAQPTGADWQTLVAAFGYHDQSHLIRDFQRFTGSTPKHLKNQLLANSLCVSNTGPVH